MIYAKGARTALKFLLLFAIIIHFMRKDMSLMHNKVCIFTVIIKRRSGPYIEELFELIAAVIF